MKKDWNISKYQLLSLLVVVSIFVITLFFSIWENNLVTPRYHQHLEQPGEEELDACLSCGGQAKLCTHLPIIRIETGGQKIPGAAILDDQYFVTDYETGTNGETEILVNLSTVEKEGWHHVDDEADISCKAMIRYRGNTSRAFDKHNIKIELVEEEDPLNEREEALLGMTADNEWALQGPFLDKTLLRNYMWMNISAEVMGYAPNVRFCEVLIDGEYQGVYVLMETISRGGGRINVTKYNAGDPFCSYIVRIGADRDPLKTIDNFTRYTMRMEEGHEIEVIYPGLQYQTQQIHDYICTDLSETERILYSADMMSEGDVYRDYIDVDSFVNYYILQEFLAVNDAFSESTYFYKDVRGKLHIGPVWDYNNSLNNFMRPLDMENFILSQRSLYARLMMDEDFVEQVISRYRYLRGNVLSDRYLNAYMDETIDWLGTAVERNFEVWGYSFDPQQLTVVQYRQPSMEEVESLAAADPEHFEENYNAALEKVNPSDYEEAVEWLRTAMLQRAAWLDKHIESLRQYCAESKNAQHILN